MWECMCLKVGGDGNLLVRDLRLRQSNYHFGENMTKQITSASLSRIDKLFLDQGVDIDKAKQQRTSHGLELVAGNDLPSHHGLQLSLLTAINLGVKCFGGNVTVFLSEAVLNSPCLTRVCTSPTLGQAIKELGAQVVDHPDSRPAGPYLALGDVASCAKAIRVTYDGWRACVGPSITVARLAERDYCPLASIAAAALAVGEIFASFAGLSVSATRRVVELSLWRPDLRGNSDDTIGLPLQELPKALSIFGLGHLGQAYIWALASLPYVRGEEAEIQLCDFDLVEEANIETGALLTPVTEGLLKTRVVAAWLEKRGFNTKLLERRVDENFRRTTMEPVIALSGFDNNEARQYLAGAGFNAIFDSGLGGEAYNFDTIGFHSWPNSRNASDLWLVKTTDERAIEAERLRKRTAENAAYQAIKNDECGRLILAGKSVAVPFVGALAACIVLAEMSKSINGGPAFHNTIVRMCSIGVQEWTSPWHQATPIRGVATTMVRPANSD